MCVACRAETAGGTTHRWQTELHDDRRPAGARQAASVATGGLADHPQARLQLAEQDLGLFFQAPEPPQLDAQDGRLPPADHLGRLGRGMVVLRFGRECRQCWLGRGSDLDHRPLTQVVDHLH